MSDDSQPESLDHGTYKPPFPYFGGKSRIAALVWDRFGRIDNYVEPFLGSAAMLMLRPAPITGTETANDLDGFVSNFWRALQADPDQVAEHADYPVLECDLHARHAWLVERKKSMQAQLEGNSEWYDAKIAGWWVWGMACWIGRGFCSGEGPWHQVETADGWRLENGAEKGNGITRELPHLRHGRGVNRKLPHLHAGRSVNRPTTDLYEYLHRLAERMRRVRVCCGDWSRVCGPTPTIHQGLTAVFLDPPYADTAGRYPDIYTVDSLKVAHDVREWAVANGANPLLRIALCGYEGEHQMPDNWACVAWKANGGYQSQRRSPGGRSVNSHRERLWFSPHCLDPDKTAYPLFANLNEPDDDDDIDDETPF